MRIEDKGDCGMKGSIKTKLDIEAYERDGYKCVDCGKSTGIEAHHIIPNLEELDNLVTLCHACHKKRHNMAGCFKTGHDSRRKLQVWPKTFCSVQGCSGSSHGRRLCKMHYERERRAGLLWQHNLAQPIRIKRIRIGAVAE